MTTRRKLSTLLVAAASAATLLPTGADAAAPARVDLHIPAAAATAGSKHVRRFTGYVSFRAPTGWTRRRVGGSGEQLVTAKFSRTLTPGCVVTAYVSSIASVSTLGPVRQLKSQLPRSPSSARSSRPR